MSHIHSHRNRLALLLAALSFAVLVPKHAVAQGFDLAKVSGKTFPEVNGMLGKPVETQGTPVTYARFNTGAIDTIVWFRYNTGLAMRAQVVALAKPGETYQEILKRYHVSVGSNPTKLPLKAPMYALHNSAPIAGLPWSSVTVTYANVMPFQTGTVKWCKEHGLKPSDTNVWSIQVKNSGSRGAGNAMSTEGTPSGGKGKGRGGRRKK